MVATYLYEKGVRNRSISSMNFFIIPFIFPKFCLYVYQNYYVNLIQFCLFFSYIIIIYIILKFVSNIILLIIIIIKHMQKVIYIVGKYGVDDVIWSKIFIMFDCIFVLCYHLFFPFSLFLFNIYYRCKNLIKHFSSFINNSTEK